MKVVYLESFLVKARRRRRKKLLAMKAAALNQGDMMKVQVINEELSELPKN